MNTSSTVGGKVKGVKKVKKENNRSVSVNEDETQTKEPPFDPANEDENQDFTEKSNSTEPQITQDSNIETGMEFTKLLKLIFIFINKYRNL